MTATHDDVAPELIDAMVRLRPGGMVWRRTFPGRADQVPEARRFVRFLLADSPHQDDAEQITAELASNAIAHTNSGQPRCTFIVELIRKATTLRVTVYDCGWGGIPRFAPRGRADPLDERGRGLSLVAALASQVGYRGTRTLGHAVWAQFTAEDLPATPEHP